MAKSLSYQEALTKGLVYPGAEQEALKITGGGKGFADTEAFKKAFDTAYQTKKSEVDELGGRISELSNTNANISRLRSISEQGGDLFAFYNAVRATKYFNQAPNYNIWFKADAAHKLLIDDINRLADQQKGLSGTMEQAMAKYKATSEKAIEGEKRDISATQAARKRLTRGTAGLLAKAGGAGGMVGTGLPMLGEGTSPQLGMEGQLGKKFTL